MRVAIGERGHRASIWRIWANRSTSDVYVAARAIIGVQKFSLHQSGDWRYQWIGGNAEIYTDSNNRIIDRWERPPEPAHGWTRSVAIEVPHGHIDDIADDPDADVMWLPEGPVGHLGGFQIAVATPDKGEIDLKGMFPLGGFQLVSGECVIVLYSQRQETNDDLTYRRQALRRTEKMLSARGHSLAELIDQHETGAIRFAVHGNDEHDVRHVLDLSLKIALTEAEADSAPPGGGSRES